MGKASIGKLPAHLVIIFVVSLVIATLCGFMLKFSEDRDAGSSYLVQRLSPQESKPALSEEVLRGVWVHEAGGYITTIKIENGIFELISRYARNPVNRFFIRGGYKSDGNVLILQSREDLGTPLDTMHLEYRYYPIQFTPLNLYAESNGQVMIWKTPQKERNRFKAIDPALEDIFGVDSTWIKIAAAP